MRLRLAELIAALSLATDLGLGLPQEHVLRQCRIALGLAERVGVDDAERAAVYYVAMLAWVGCTADSYELAAQFGDEIAFRADAITPTSRACRGGGRGVGGGRGGRGGPGGGGGRPARSAAGGRRAIEGRKGQWRRTRQEESRVEGSVIVARGGGRLPEPAVTELRRAGLVHDLGRAGVPTRSGTSRAR